MQKCQYLYEKLTCKAYAENMKSEIKYNAADDAREIVGRWQDWLKSERGYSEHTLDAYFRDLSAFFAFFEKPLTLAKLGRLDVRDFRAYLASRAAKHLEKSSIAREVSAVKNFFKWLDRNNIVKNPAISVISSPRKSKILPKALDMDDAFDVLRRAAELQNAKNPGDAYWMSLRDKAVFTLLYGCGRIEAFPVDVWVKRIMAELYPEGLPECTFGIEGIAQQFLFHWRRNTETI